MGKPRAWSESVRCGPMTSAMILRSWLSWLCENCEPEESCGRSGEESGRSASMDTSGFMQRWGWAARAVDLCLVAGRMFVFMDTLGQTRLRASSHEIPCQGEKNKGIPWESIELGQSQ